MARTRATARAGKPMQRKSTSVSVAKIAQQKVDPTLQKRLRENKSWISWLVHQMLMLLHTLLLGQRYAGRLDFFQTEDACFRNNCLQASRPFKAIMWKLSRIDDKRVWNLREQTTPYHLMFHHPAEIQYEILQDDVITIGDDVHVQRDYRVENLPNMNSQGTHVKYVTGLHVFSKVTHTASDLIRIVDGFIEEHEQYLLAKEKKSQYMYVLRSKEGILDDDTHILQMTFQSTRTFDNFFFKNKESILGEVDFFLEHKEWYAEMGVPETLGILLHGEPGCGKTSFIKALLNYTGRHGVIVSLNSSTDLSAIEQVMGSDTILNLPIPQDKRIYIIEDVDAMGDLVCKRDDDETTTTNETDDGLFLSLVRKIKKKSDADHLSTVLNLLDGIVEHTGRIIVMTTNHPEKLDPALVRPGRVDINAAFKRCDRPILAQILSNFYQATLTEDDIPSGIISDFFTPAQVVQICKADKLNVKNALSVMNDICLNRGTRPTSDDNLSVDVFKNSTSGKKKPQTVSELEKKWEAKVVEAPGGSDDKDITFGMHKLGKTETKKQTVVRL